MREIILYPIATERHVPSFVKESRIMMAIYSTENKVLAQALWDINQLYDQAFMDTITDPMLELLEQWWSIAIPQNATLEDRILAVRAKMASRCLYTKRSLHQMLASLCGPDGFVLTINHSGFIVKVLVELKNKNQVDTIKHTLHTVLPANMIYEVTIRYNQWYMLKPFRYEEIKDLTYKEVKEDEIVRETFISKGGVLQ